jgi:rod shape-determining protein MreC
MQQIINFIIRYKNFLLYILLFVFALALTIQSHSFHNSRFFNSASWISGNIYKTSYGISSYLDLSKENRRLLKENRVLRKQLINQKLLDTVEMDTTGYTYTIISAQVIKNSYANPKNYITINKGKKHHIKQDMGVITTNGILGIVENTSSNFATVQSILNTKSNINAKIKNTNHNGSLVWDTKAYNVAQLVDIPRLVPLMVGDTIVTGGMSSIFPPNIPIGVIKKFDLNTSKSAYTVDVALFNDMTNLQNVYIIDNINRPEIIELESKTNGQ